MLKSNERILKPVHNKDFAETKKDKLGTRWVLFKNSNLQIQKE